ncbi:PhnD/SsuA/transferrin family substrate-binding protein [bacterium]|nr:PhnD/SsuA/transferrin family substrate-binding protein [bacterium]
MSNWRWVLAGLLIMVVTAAFSAVMWRILMDITTDPAPSEQVAVLPMPDGEPIAFGVVSRYTPRKIYRGYQPIMDYLSEATGRTFVLRLSDSYAQTVQQLVDGEVAFASLGNYTYIHAHAEHGIRGLVVPLNDEGRPFFHSVVVVRDDSRLESLSDLSGRDFAFTSPSSMSYWMALHLLRGADLDRDDLGTVANFSHHETVAEKVLRGEFAAGAIKDIVARQYDALGLRILTVSPPIPAVPIAVRPDLDPELMRSVLDALLALDPTRPADAARLTSWDPEFSHGFAVARDEDYDTMRRILKALEGDISDVEGGP